MGTAAQADIEEWFLHWTVLTDIYALFAMVVSFVPPYIRRGSRKMATLAFGILLAFSGGVLHASSTTSEQVSLATHLNHQYHTPPDWPD
jgi:hypothetical protein